MMIKNFAKFLLAFILVLSFTLSFSATDDMVPDGVSDAGVDISGNIVEDSVSDSDIIDTQQPVSLGNDCLCGREYYTEDSSEHSKYDCIKCGKNMYACTCNCWCGASSILYTSGAYGSISPRICSGCKKICSECDCRDDKAEVLAAEKLRLNGEISPLNLPRPENGLNLFFSLFTMLLLVSAAVFLPNAPFMKKKDSVSVDNIDIVEVFSKTEEVEVYNKPERAYESPESEKAATKKTAVAPVEVSAYGISVSEKINLPWITSGKRMINVNVAMAKVIVNDNEVFCGDFISLNELSEELMSKDSEADKRDSRFPEFFGAMPESNETEGENS